MERFQIGNHSRDLPICNALNFGLCSFFNIINDLNDNRQFVRNDNIQRNKLNSYRTRV